MAYLLVTALIVIVFNLVADILYGFRDPRIRLNVIGISAFRSTCRQRFESVASIVAFVEAGLGPVLVPALAAEPTPELVAVELDPHPY
jgi:DNA-binding transcriptional LysR family regulator